MTRDRLFLLRPDFEDPAYPAGASIAGIAR